MLAALLGWPQGTFASKIEVNAADVVVTREVDGGHQTVRLAAAGDRDRRSASQSAAVCEPAQHHEGQAGAAGAQAAGRPGLDTGVRLEVLKMADPPHTAKPA